MVNEACVSFALQGKLQLLLALSVHSPQLRFSCHSISLILQQLVSVLETACLVSPIRDNDFSASWSRRKVSLPLPGTLGRLA